MKLVPFSKCVLVLLGTFVIGCGEDRPPPPPPPPGFVPGQPIQPVTPTQPNMPGVPGVPGTPATVTLSPGFVPDPHVVRGTSGGAVQASNLSPQCTGWIAQNPNHLLNATAPFTNLRIIVGAGTQDTTLVVQKPDGTYVCDDDSEGMNPIVQGPITTPGVHRIWVGSYTRAESIPYTLGFSELTGTTAASLTGNAPGVPPLNPPIQNPTAGGSVDTNGTSSNFGEVSLSPGFLPDPHVVSGTSGGSVSATSLGSGCLGFVSHTPDHQLQINGSIPSLRVMAKSTTDLTLVVHRPDGQFMCNDDSDGTNPMVEGNFPPGRYRVWVGSYAQGQNGSYRLGISAQPGMTPSRLQ